MPQTYDLRLFPEARDDLIRLREFIHEHNPAAAKRAAQAIQEGMSKLTHFPFLGHEVIDMDIQELRDLFVPFGQSGYWIRYLVKPPHIYVVKIWNGKENPFHPKPLTN
jgi:toxin ParE1/3/4